MKSDVEIDSACSNLCIAINKMPGIMTTGSCSGHGKAPYRIFLEIESFKSLGAITLLRCISPEYYNYYIGEKRLDPYWRLVATDTDVNHVIFILEGKTMENDYEFNKPAERLATNILTHIKENYKIARLLYFSRRIGSWHAK